MTPLIFLDPERLWLLWWRKGYAYCDLSLSIIECNLWLWFFYVILTQLVVMIDLHYVEDILQFVPWLPALEGYSYATLRACGRGDGCYYCETSGLWHSVWGLQQPQSCSQVSLLLPDTTKLSKRRLIWSVCAFFFWQTPQCSSRNTTYSESNFQGLCLLIIIFFVSQNVEKKYEGPLNNLLSLDCSQE